MRKITFQKGVEKLYLSVVNSLIKKNVPKDSAYEAVQAMVETQLETKAYLAVDGDTIDGKLYSYLRQAAAWKHSNMMNRLARENAVMVSIIDEDERKDDVRTREKAEHECPYCHEGILNTYKACAECGTILGQGKQLRERVSIEEEELFEYPNLDLHIDVEAALQHLTPLERRVVEAVVSGKDTLDGIADTEATGRSTLYRVYADAKRKLQSSLIEYAPC
jgi:hypothetical protein